MAQASTTPPQPTNHQLAAFREDIVYLAEVLAYCDEDLLRLGKLQRYLTQKVHQAIEQQMGPAWTQLSLSSILESASLLREVHSMTLLSLPWDACGTAADIGSCSTARPPASTGGDTA